MDAPHRRWLRVLGEKLSAIVQECCELYWASPGGSIPQNCSCMETFHPSRKPSKLDEQDMRDTAGEVRANSLVMHPSRSPSYGRLGDQLEPTYNCSVLIQDVAWKTNRKQWTIRINGGKGSRKSVPVVRHDNNHHVFILALLYVSNVDVPLNKEINKTKLDFLFLLEYQH